MKSYRVAGHRFYSDFRSSRMESFAEGVASDPSPPAAVPQDEPHWRRVFCDSGLVAGAKRVVECRQGDHGYRLRIDGIGVFVLTADGASIAVDRTPGCSDDIVFQALVGPALILAMALRGRFALHASSVVRDGEALVFMGPSGSGKSTLARKLAGLPGGGWSRISDDILPMRLSGGATLRCRADYPQLGLDVENRPPSGGAAEWPVCRCFVLAPPGVGDRNVGTLPLGHSEAALALVRHSVACRLFAKDLLEKHLHFCSRVSEQVAIARLGYPWTQGSIPRVGELLESLMVESGSEERS